MKTYDIQIEKITSELCTRRGFGDIITMKRSIASYGLLHPIGINSKFELVYGRCRLEACRQLGWKTIPAIFIQKDERSYSIQRAENLIRRDLTPGEMADLGLKIQDEIRQHPVNVLSQGKSDNPCSVSQDRANLRDSNKEPSEVAAKAAGFKSKRTYNHAVSVIQKGSKRLIDAMNQKKVSISAAAQLSKLPKDEQEQLDYGNPKALKQKARELRIKKTAGNTGACLRLRSA